MANTSVSGDRRFRGEDFMQLASCLGILIADQQVAGDLPNSNTGDTDDSTARPVGAAWLGVCHCDIGRQC